MHGYRLAVERYHDLREQCRRAEVEIRRLRNVAKARGAKADELLGHYYIRLPAKKATTT